MKYEIDLSHEFVEKIVVDELRGAVDSIKNTDRWRRGPLQDDERDVESLKRVIKYYGG